MRREKRGDFLDSVKKMKMAIGRRGIQDRIIVKRRGERLGRRFRRGK